MIGIRVDSNKNIGLGHVMRCLSIAEASKNRDKILFIEELGMETGPALVSNHLYYMKQNGIFDQIKGIWVGNYTHESQITLEDIILDTLRDEYRFPIIKSENFGHIERKTVIPIGTRAVIDTSKEIKIQLVERCVL